jgi:hypothetical protein
VRLEPLLALLEQQPLLDLIPHFIDRFRLGGHSLLQLDEVIAVRSLDRLADLPDLQGKRHRLQLLEERLLLQRHSLHERGQLLVPRAHVPAHLTPLLLPGTEGPLERQLGEVHPLDRRRPDRLGLLQGGRHQLPHPDPLRLLEALLKPLVVPLDLLRLDAGLIRIPSRHRAQQDQSLSLFQPARHLRLPVQAQGPGLLHQQLFLDELLQEELPLIEGAGFSVDEPGRAHFRHEAPRIILRQRLHLLPEPLDHHGPAVHQRQHSWIGELG